MASMGIGGGPCSPKNADRGKCSLGFGLAHVFGITANNKAIREALG